ncbi:methylthioribulose-1-phosphate dehydratase-like [Xenia sp. Carnegie-2017]|uniref:methylthioribulose-1-phosphate dehydratase-like n=1 Tax=Xenia sp. Carnegie-2017 TaxID=2897299 RepID=UPI001F0388CD|nr:methylthioribulose-1-phosphate dehydratase-like [Xenia sp. Carnegie-2017]
MLLRNCYDYIVNNSPLWLNFVCASALSGMAVYCIMRRKCSRTLSDSNECVISNAMLQSTDDPRVIIPRICVEFHRKGWMSGSGGAISIKSGNEIFVSPSGILKEQVTPELLFLCNIDGDKISGPSARFNLTESSCTPMFLNAYRKRAAGAVFHIHTLNAVMVTALCHGNEFRISHQQMIKAIVNCRTGRNYRYDEELVIPIVENENEEIEIKDSIVRAMELYPETSAVLVRNHGIYLWAKNWRKAKIMCEAYDYIFEVVVKMKVVGLDPFNNLQK